MTPPSASRSRILASSLIWAPVLIAGALSSSAQSDTGWSALGEGTIGGVYALAAGSGDTLYAGGEFTVAGGVDVERVAMWDGGEWHAMGDGFQGQVQAFARGAGGQLYATGSMAVSGATQINYVARWDGERWNALGAGLGNPGNSIAVGPDGSVYVGTLAVLTPDAAVLRWDGFDWDQVGDGFTGGSFRSLVDAVYMDPAGTLYAGGDFAMVGDIAASGIARWNGSAWEPLGSGVADPLFAGFGVKTMVTDVSGHLFVAGNFSTAGGEPANNVARWDGSRWHPVGDGIAGVITQIGFDGAGVLYAGGLFVHVVPNVTQTSGIARWDGHMWGALNGEQNDRGVNGAFVTTMVLDGQGSLYVGGNFASVGTDVVPASNVARWSGVAGTSSQESALPGSFHLSPAYPNPFNPSTQFTLVLDQRATVRIGVFDVLGREVARLQDGSLSPGRHAFVWNAEGLSSGVYLVRASTNLGEVARSVVLSK